MRAVAYDWRAQAAEIRASGLPAECAEVIESGWWSRVRTLPEGERQRAAEMRQLAGAS